MNPGSVRAEQGEQGRPRETGASLRVAGVPTWVAPGVVWLASIALAGVKIYSNYSRAAELHRSQDFNDFVWTVLNARADLGHAGLVHMYQGNGSILVALPGFSLLLVGLIRVLTLVGISAPGEGLIWLHGGHYAANYLAGRSWWVVYGFSLGVSLAALFPLDALARRCGITGLRRGALLVALGVSLWSLAVPWGHPEDGLAMGFLAWAALRALDGRWRPAGWLLGFGIAVQTLAVLGAPIVFAMAGVRRWPRLLARAVIPGLIAIAIPLIGDPSDTLRQVVKQPTYPLNRNARITPWLSVVPHPHVGIVDAGWPRTVAVLLAFLLALLVIRWWGPSGTLTPSALIWTIGVSLSLRCVFESVMFSYYLMPPLLFFLVAAFNDRGGGG